MQSWVLGDPKTACAAPVKEWNGTWAEAAEVDPRECATSYIRVKDWHFFTLCLLLRLSDGLSCPCNLSCLLLLVRSLWSLCSGEHPRDRSVARRLSLFLDLSRFLSRSLSPDLWPSLSFCSMACDFDSLSEIHTLGFPDVVLPSTLTE